MASKISSTSNTTTVLSRRLGVLLAVAAGTTTALAQVGLNNWTEAAPEAQPASQPGSQQTGDVKVSDDMTVDLHVKDEELAIVLEMLSLQSQKNIIASKDVSARVTANLYGVTFYEALDAILNVNGYGFVEDGNFIKVYTLDEINKINAAARVKVSQVIPLNYLAAVDAAEFVKPLLSPEGQIKVNSKAAPFASMSEVPVGDEEYAQNSMMVIYDFEENVEQVREMVKIIDTRPAQVLVEATILQTQLNEANALGVDFSLIADMSFADLANGPLTAAQAIITGNDGDDNLLPADGEARAVSSTVGGTAGQGGLKVGIIANDIGVFLRALDEVTDTTVISNPKIMTLNRQSSRVLVGRKVGYLNTTSTDTATTQSVEFLDTGTQLYFRPFVTNDGLIRMELKPAVSEAAIRAITDVTGAAVTIPDEITNELTTNVLVRDGQTVVLGGLFREKVESTRRQVPLLGDIPIIGQAFRGNQDDMNRNEIIFLITPTILNDTLIADAGARGADYVDHITAGGREGMLWFSRDKLTNNLNVDAERYLAEGKTKEALHAIDRSLALNPRQPELIAKREKVTNEKMPQTNRSFLDRVINLEADDHLLQTGVDESLSMDNESTWDGPTSDQFMSSPEFSGNVVAQDFQPQDFQQSTTEQPTEFSWPVSTMEHASIQPTTEFSTPSTPTETVPAQTFEFGTEQVAQQPVVTPAQPAATQQAATGTPSPFGGSIRSYYQWLKQRKQQQSYTNVTGDQVDNR
ncbi:MAG TPA: hypothetical protein VHN77_05215 [Phycisphaerales bacterium]|nr:hypothetical protein [Phycisphaerales bacterium]